MFIDKVQNALKSISNVVFVQGRYRFIVIDNYSHQIMLDEYFFTKARAVGCLQWHQKIGNNFRYQLIDTSTGEDITYE